MVQARPGQPRSATAWSATSRSQLFGKLVRADLARLRASHSGAFVSSVLYDAGLIREAATTGVVNYTQHLLTVHRHHLA